MSKRFRRAFRDTLCSGPRSCCCLGDAALERRASNQTRLQRSLPLVVSCQNRPRTGDEASHSNRAAPLETVEVAGEVAGSTGSASRVVFDQSENKFQQFYSVPNSTGGSYSLRSSGDSTEKDKKEPKKKSRSLPESTWPLCCSQLDDDHYANDDQPQTGSIHKNRATKKRLRYRRPAPVGRSDNDGCGVSAMSATTKGRTDEFSELLHKSPAETNVFIDVGEEATAQAEASQ